MKKILNLYSGSEIPFKLSEFPDGQQNVSVDLSSYQEGIRLSVEIRSRLNTFMDLERIICANQSLKLQGVKEVSLYVPYFLGSRSDRRFTENDCNYLRDVICPIINSQSFESITTLDPHSDVLEACIPNLKTINNHLFVKGSLESISNNLTILSPDAGANKKIFKLAKQIQYNDDIITCSKLRDDKGELSKTFVPLSSKYLEKDFVIIDDICDGGKTFINIAKEIKKWDTSNSCKSYLIVTHGIFSKGFNELEQYFHKIFCTNSYSDIDTKKFNLIKQFLVI